ncbi:hypothetical protein [Sporosalibacterium faouarense]|nr:hypothetical protein [Sporosalibacterium faouarense]
MGKKVSNQLKEINEKITKLEENQNIINDNILRIWKSIKELGSK